MLTKRYGSLLLLTFALTGCLQNTTGSSDTSSTAANNSSTTPPVVMAPIINSIGQSPLLLNQSPYVTWSPGHDPNALITVSTQAQVIRVSDGAVIFPWSSFSPSSTYLPGLTLQTGVSYALQLRSINSLGLFSSVVTSASWTARVGSGTWGSISSINAPSARGFHSAVWTGSKMIVWGGQGSTGAALNTGGIYDPTSDTWQTMSVNGGPSGRVTSSVVWTGSKLIVWGGTTGTS